MSELAALASLQRASYGRADEALRSSWPQERSMDATALETFLARRSTGVLATTTRQGHAQARPVGFVVCSGTFWFASVAGGRLANLERLPWASFVVSEGEGASHSALAVDGPVAIAAHPGEGVLERWEVRFGARPGWAAAWLELRPERLFSHRA